MRFALAILMLPLACAAQPYLNTRDIPFLFSAQPANAVTPVPVNMLETFQGGTNGNVIGNTNSITNVLSFNQNYAAAPAFTFLGGAQTLTTFDKFQRFTFDNSQLPPSPYTTFGVGTTNFGGTNLAFTLRYTHQTNTLVYSNTFETIQFKPPASTLYSTNWASVDILTRLDNTGGGANSADLMVLQHGASSSIFNLMQSAGNALTFRLEGNSGDCGHITGATNHWYRAVINTTNGGDTMWLLDLQTPPPYAIVGVVGSNSLWAASTVNIIKIGQDGHAAMTVPVNQSYTWFANLTFSTNNSATISQYQH